MTEARFEQKDMAYLSRVMVSDLHEESSDHLAFDLGELWMCDKDDNIWKKVPDAKLKNLINSYSGQLYIKGYDKNNEPQHGVLQINAWKVAVDFVKAAPFEWDYGDGFFEGAPVGVAFKDKFVAMNEDGELDIVPLHASHRVMWSLPCDYEPCNKGKKWSYYLESIFEGDDQAEAKLKILQEFVGAALFGLACRYQKALLLLGDGSNGKSVFLEVVSRLIPREARSCVPPSGMDDPLMLADLIGARMNIVTELPSTHVLESSGLKAIITGEIRKARELYKPAVEFFPQAAHLFAANSLPPVSDHSKGFWRRWLVVGFNRTFSGDQIIYDLAEQIIEKELGAVASWAIEGAQRLVKQKGYTDFTAGDGLLDMWRRDTDSVTAFVFERCEPDAMEGGEYVWSQASKVYEAYKDWSKDNGFYPVNRTKFGRRIAVHIERKEKHNFPGGPRGSRGYRCALLFPDEPPKIGGWL